MKTTLVIPAYNEEEALPITLDEYTPYVDEIIVVDDGSKDDTEKVALRCSLENSKIKYIKHEKNMGKPRALRTGVSNSTGDIVIFTDADHTYPAKYVPELVGMIRKGSDLVLGARALDGINIPTLNRLGNKLFSMLITYFCYTKIEDAQTGMRAMRRNVFKDLDVPARNLEYETKMTMRAAKLGYNVTEVSIEYRKRIGHSKLNPVRDGYNMIKSIPVIIWQESTPLLKGVIIVNILMFGIGIFFGSFSIYEKLTHGVITHEFYPLVSVVLILASIQLMSFSLIMDYIVNKLSMIESKLSMR